MTTIPLDAEIAGAMRRMYAARDFPTHTCSASRHAAQVADLIMRGRAKDLVDPREAGLSIAATVAALWEARAEIARLRVTE